MTAANEILGSKRRIVGGFSKRRRVKRGTALSAQLRDEIVEMPPFVRIGSGSSVGSDLELGGIVQYKSDVDKDVHSSPQSPKQLQSPTIDSAIPKTRTNSPRMSFEMPPH